MKISRKKVIDALRYEPLSACDGFVATGSNSKANKDCKVCAVGAALRRHGVKNSGINKCMEGLLWDTDYVQGSIVDSLEDGNYMAALSQKFEQESRGGEREPKDRRRYFGKRFRESLVLWVKQNLPKEFQF